MLMLLLQHKRKEDEARKSKHAVERERIKLALEDDRRQRQVMQELTAAQQAAAAEQQQEKQQQQSPATSPREHRRSTEH